MKTKAQLASEEAIPKARIEKDYLLGLPDLGGTGNYKNVLTGAMTRNGVLKSLDLYACHKKITYYSKCNTFWSAFNYRVPDPDQSNRFVEAAKAFHTWLCTESPWAKTGIVPADYDVDFMFNHGFIFTKLHTVPANLLHNFLVASRIPVEWPYFCLGWYELVTEHGINPVLALVSLDLFRPYNSEYKSWVNANSQISYPMDNKYDWPFDIVTASEEYLLNLLQAKTPGLSERKFFPSAHTSPVNILWGNPVHPNLTYISFLKKTYPAIAGVTSKFGTISYTYSKEQVIEVLKNEQKRLQID